MKEQMNILVDLQRIESESAGLRSALADVPETLAVLEVELQVAEKRISEKESVFKEQKKKYRSQEGEVQQIGSRIRSSQAKLHAVKTNREYQALLKEIDDLQARNSSLEDDMLEFLEHMEHTEQEIAAERDRYRSHEQAVAAEKDEILKAAEGKRLRLERLKRERAQTVARLNPALLTRFKQVMAAHPDGLAVAAVENATCSGCHLNIPPQMFNELQKCETLRLCPTCERIIYWREA